jgi:hypothetical protein
MQQELVVAQGPIADRGQLARRVQHLRLTCWRANSNRAALRRPTAADCAPGPTGHEHPSGLVSRALHAHKTTALAVVQHHQPDPPRGEHHRRPAREVSAVCRTTSAASQNAPATSATARTASRSEQACRTAGRGADGRPSSAAAARLRGDHPRAGEHEHPDHARLGDDPGADQLLPPRRCLGESEHRQAPEPVVYGQDPGRQQKHGDAVARDRITFVANTGSMLGASCLI